MKSEQILYSLSEVEEQYIAEAAPVRTHPQKRRPMMKWGIAAACLVLAITAAGVGSVVSAGIPGRNFGQLFETLPETHYEDLLFDIQQSKTDNGVTVTITQALCDGNALYVIEQVEFAPSILTLTDDMFVTNEYGGYPHLPFWGVNELVNVKRADADQPPYSLDAGFVKLLAHDAHSITRLQVYSNESTLGTVDSFFTDGTAFSLHYGSVEWDGNAIPCSIVLDFEMKKVSKPTCYTLPASLYHTAQDMDVIVDTHVADVLVNPWYMRFAGCGLTGKILDVPTQSADTPAIEVTMADGTVYTENNGISMYQDYFGKDYNPYNAFHCDFDKPVDIQSIRSIKLYGVPLEKGMTSNQSK